NRAPIPERGAFKVWLGYEFAPEHAKLKTHPRRRERRNAIIFVERTLIDGIRLDETVKIGKHRAQRYRILEPVACRGHPAACIKHRLEFNATGLIDRQQLTLYRLAGCAHRHGAGETRSRIIE